jgi:hypothetical protein
VGWWLLSISYQQLPYPHSADLRGDLDHYAFCFGTQNGLDHSVFGVLSLIKAKAEPLGSAFFLASFS